MRMWCAHAQYRNERYQENVVSHKVQFIVKSLTLHSNVCLVVLEGSRFLFEIK
jgi:hypothetical protein